MRTTMNAQNVTCAILHLPANHTKWLCNWQQCYHHYGDDVNLT